MTMDAPCIAAVSAASDTALRVNWEGGGEDVVELAGWIGRTSPLLAPLRDPVLFRQPQIVAYGSAVGWGDPDGDLAIDSHHLILLATEQRSFKAEDLAVWQLRAQVTDQEAAEFLGIPLSAWIAYKAGAEIPKVVGMVCRAAVRDPVLFSAHLRPKMVGRARSSA
ncbi:hypothetical protein [Methylobacterium platani]|nr:hypothetical protein [Methylobacterium platani]